MRELVTSTFTAYAPDEYVWKQERNVMHVIRKSASYQSVHVTAEVEGFSSYVELDYTFGNDGVVDIDFTDVVRQGKIGSGYTLSIAVGNIPADADYIIKGLINPANVIIPRGGLVNVLTDYVSTDNPLFMMPQRILQSISMVRGNSPLIVENYGLDMFHANVFLVIDNEKETEISAASTIDISGAKELLLWSDERTAKDLLYTRALVPLECGHTYASVRWVSFTGQVRCATWELSSQSQAVTDEVNLAMVDGSYNVLKGREDACTLFLDSLTAYDLWYYSDVATSSKVEVSFDGGQSWRAVKVSTKDVQVKAGDEGKLYKCEINVKFANYDAISM